MDNERLIELMTRKVSGTITLAEMRELNTIINKDEENKQFSGLLHNLINGHFEVAEKSDSADLEKRVRRINEKLKTIEDDLDHKVISINKRRILYIAAVLMLAIGAASVFYILNSKKEKTLSKNIMATKPGSKSMIVLSDGTKVWLNADTKLTYEKSYGEKTRSVDLVGEAYFDVVKDAEHPFVVHTKAMDIKVLGTAFNVRAYEKEINTQTTLLRGRIEVTLRNKKDEKVILKPNEKITVKNNELSSADPVGEDKNDVTEMSIVSIQNKKLVDSTANEIQWTKNRLVFDQTDFSDIVTELERWYGVNIIVKEPSILNRRLSGIYENESLTEVLESFKLATGLKYTLSENTLIIYK